MDELKRQTRMLDDDVKQLTEEVHRLNSRVDRTDKIWRWLVAGLLLVVALVALLGYVAARAEQTARETDELRGQVLCPLYGLILGGYDPESRAEGEARRKYEETFAVIRDGYGVLHCTTPLVPPRSN